jgi:hypothetical protein
MGCIILCAVEANQVFAAKVLPSYRGETCFPRTCSRAVFFFCVCVFICVFSIASALI